MNKVQMCDCETIHEEAVQYARNAMTSLEEYQNLAALFKLFGDPTRVRILHALEARELCVCDLAAVLEMTKSAVSHQLKSLRMSNLVTSRREGQVVYYSLADEHVKEILDIGFTHIHE